MVIDSLSFWGFDLVLIYLFWISFFISCLGVRSIFMIELCSIWVGCFVIFFSEGVLFFEVVLFIFVMVVFCWVLGSFLGFVLLLFFDFFVFKILLNYF